MFNHKLEVICNKFLIACIIGIYTIFLLRINIDLFNFLPLSLLFRIFSIVGMVCMGVLCLLNRSYFTKDFQLLFLFYAILVISTLLNRHTLSSMSITQLVMTFDYFFLFYFAGKYFAKDLKKYMVNSTYFVIVLLSIISLYLYFSGSTLTFPHGYTVKQIFGPPYGNRLYNIFIQPNQAAILCIIAFILSFYLSKIHSQFKYYFYLIAILELVILLLTQSRTNYLLLIGIITIYLLSSSSNLKCKKQIMVILGLGFIAAVIFLLIMRPIHFQQASLYDFLNRLSSNRLLLWKDAFLLTKGWHILLGNGIHAYSKIRSETLGKVFGYAFDNTHNLFVDTYFASGIIGVFILFAFIIFTIKTIQKNKSTNSTPWIQVCAYLCLTLFLFAQLDCAILFISKSYNLLFWFMLGSLISNNQ